MEVVILEVAQQHEAAEEVERDLPAQPGGEVAVSIQEDVPVRRRSSEHDHAAVTQHSHGEAVAVLGAHFDQERDWVRQQLAEIAEVPVSPRPRRCAKSLSAARGSVSEATSMAGT